MTQKNLVGVQTLLLTISRERCTTGIALKTNSRRINLLPLMVRSRMVKKLSLGFLEWGNISKSRTTLEIWRLEYPSSIWLEEHPYGGSTSGKWKILMNGILCGHSSRIISSRSTSLTGTMMTRLKSSMSWNWDNWPWKNMQRNSWSCWGMSGIPKMTKWKSSVFRVGYLSLTKTWLSLMNLEL